MQEVEMLVQEDEFSIENLKASLENPHYEINLAEELLYGKKDRELKELHDAIEKLEKVILDKATYYCSKSRAYSRA